jgi:hypothetical protein
VINNEAMDQGYDAYWENVDVVGIPYQQETEDFGCWEAGCVKARDHDDDKGDG